MSETIIPKHIAILCDGNRRWAKNKGLLPFQGHEQAVKKTFEPLIDQAIKRGVSVLTFWIFSTENWARDKMEVEGLLNLFRYVFDKQVANFHKKGVRVRVIGNIQMFPQDIQERITKGEEKTKDNQKITVQLAMSYGGHDELVRAFQKIGTLIEKGELKAKDIDQQLIKSFLDTSDIPDPDFIVRTSGEQRLSGFMSWQSEYSEFWFPQFHFPEFTPDKLDEAIEEFNLRQRRFGK